MLGVVGRAIAVLCAALGFAACASAPVTAPSASARGTIVLSLAYASVSATQAGAWVAKEQGIFERNGLDVKLESIAGGSSPTAALLSDQVQALQISVEAMSAGVEGGDIVYVAAPVSSPLFWFVALPTVNGPADLKGKKIGATAIGSATYFADVLALQKLGLDPDKDVTLTSVNNVPAILAAMQSGQVAAGALSMPTYSQAKKLGLKTLVNVADLGFKYPSSWLAVRKSFIERDREAVTRLVRSITEAIAYELAHPTETQAILGKYAQITDQALLKESYDTLVPYLNKTPTPAIEQAAAGLKLVVMTNPKAKDADPARFVDTSFVDELAKSGFIDKLYKP